MTVTDTAAATPTTTANTAGTRARLAAVAVGLPLWAGVSLLQAATRDGFDLTRHPLSALSTGDLGFVQIANFVVAGLLVALGAGGLRTALHGTPGATWLPRLVRATGIGLVAAGIFVMDPGGGFPAGAPAGMPAMTWHGAGHMVAGAVSFGAQIAACFVIGRHLTRTGRRGAAVVSRLAGGALAVGFAWVCSGAPLGSAALAVGAITAMLWIAAFVAMLRRRT